MHDKTKPNQIIVEQRIERQSINVRLSSPLPASVSVMLGTAVTHGFDHYTHHDHHDYGAHA